MSLLRFDTFMHHALYHPEQGYYSKRISTVGARGDFSTAATLSKDLAQVIANWLKGEIKNLSTKSIPIIEIGAGSGQLMQDIFKQLPILLRKRYRFHIVETSTPLREVQQQNLVKLNVQWHDNMSDALTATEGSALIYSNELVDAFPVRIFQSNSNNTFSELYINTESRQEVFQDIASDILPDSSFFDHIHKPYTRFEVHQSFQQWLSVWAQLWKKGSMLTIDYGDSAELTLNHFPKGTLRGYLKQNRIIGDALYQSVGHQDLTSDVNFTDLINWSSKLGLNCSPLLKLHQFATQQLAKKAHTSLTTSEGVGSAFKVLINQAR